MITGELRSNLHASMNSLVHEWMLLGFMPSRRHSPRNITSQAFDVDGGLVMH